MFKSSDHFEETLVKILINFRDGVPNDTAGLDDTEHHQVIHHAYEHGLITGVTLAKVMGGPKEGRYKISSSAYITHEGLELLEKVK